MTLPAPWSPVELGMQWLGSTAGRSEFASMSLDEITIFDQALTNAQVRELMRRKPQRTGERDLDLEPGSVANIAELLSEIEAVVGRAVQRSLKRMLPEIVRALRRRPGSHTGAMILTPEP